MHAVERNVRADQSMPGSNDDDLLAKLNVKMFSYNELATATHNFNYQSVLGEGSFGPVFKGELEATGQLVAVKVLNPEGLQGNEEFMMEVVMLSRLHHPNLIKLIGCCTEEEHRLLVYEFMPLGSLNERLHDFDHTTPEMAPLDWNTRMEIAHSVAKAFNYLHNEARPPVVHRDLKPDNILLGEGFHPKVSDFGIAMFGPSDDDSRIFTDSVMGVRAYSAPEFSNTGEVTTKSDVYSFGVVLMELITGLRALDVHREKHYLADWVHYKLTNCELDIVSLADPRMNGQFPEDIFRKAINVGLNCTEDDPKLRPSMKDVVRTMDNFKYERRVVVAPDQGRGESSGESTEAHLPLSNFISPETKLAATLWGRKGQISPLNTNPYKKA
ncbi:hypothetical protein BUALT_Bualt04G0176900 [Buddleja alternifolia]|uniref:non-specific serine/threonine protein kinase n=1 Tax=Buddleja alternifolia TaxID=168488 RepID=A0AAV6XRY4_9LAMI|nr:hypothetical protein BUALT_Bualt04G0176900 [Buddleja alternifolia]